MHLCVYIYISMLKCLTSFTEVKKMKILGITECRLRTSSSATYSTIWYFFHTDIADVNINKHKMNEEMVSFYFFVLKK